MDTFYHGESNRTLLDRSLEHVGSLRRKEDKSVLWRHWMETHGDRTDPPSYEFHLMGRHWSPTERQLKEALLIQFSEADILLNEKTEFGRNWLVLQRTEERQRHSENGEQVHPRKRRRIEGSTLSTPVHPQLEIPDGKSKQRKSPCRQMTPEVSRFSRQSRQQFSTKQTDLRAYGFRAR